MTQIVTLENDSLIILLELIKMAHVRIYDCNTDTYYKIQDIIDNQVTITATRPFTIDSIIELMELIRSSSNLSLVRSGTIFILNDYSVMYSQNRDAILNI